MGNPDGYDSKIRERLRYLVINRSQSDLARKTDTLVSTVNRYLKSTKIPGEFLSAVIAGLGVNPAWLMAGEGTPYLADVSAGTSELASNLLELVEAMNQVAKMKLGALMGKHHLKVLRELNDALERYEHLRAIINKRTRVVFRELLDDLKKALREMDETRAREIRKAAVQVSRLCDDPKLTIEFDNLQEFYEHIFGDQIRALELSRKVFVRSLGASEVAMDKDHCALAINLVVSLHRADRCHEARRICRATLALYEDLGGEWGRYKQLTALHAILNIELGNMREGLRDLHSAYPLLPEQLKGSFSGKLVESMLLSGLTPIEHATAIGIDSTSKAAALVRFAALMDEREHMKDFLKRYQGDERAGLPQASVIRAYARGLLAGWGDDRKDALKDFLATVKKEGASVAVRPTQEFAYRACAAHIARAAGQIERARKLQQEATELLGSLDPKVSPQMMALALHHRNALELVPEGSRSKKPKEQRAAARAFFDAHYRKGCGAFAHFCQVAAAG